MQANDISEKLKEIRLNKELTIDSVSNMLNVSKQRYNSLWEQNKRNWSIDTLIKLSSILDFEIKIKDGELVILENNSDYIGEDKKNIKNKLQNNFEFQADFNNKDNNYYLIKKIINKNILNKYPLCNYMFNTQANLFLSNKIVLPEFSISESEIKEVYRKNMNFSKRVNYIKYQTSTYLIIYDYSGGYKITAINLFVFNDTNPNNYNGTYLLTLPNVADRYCLGKPRLNHK